MKFKKYFFCLSVLVLGGNAFPLSHAAANGVCKEKLNNILGSEKGPYYCQNDDKACNSRQLAREILVTMSPKVEPECDKVLDWANKVNFVKLRFNSNSKMISSFTKTTSLMQKNSFPISIDLIYSILNHSLRIYSSRMMHESNPERYVDSNAYFAHMMEYLPMTFHRIPTPNGALQIQSKFLTSFFCALQEDFASADESLFRDGFSPAQCKSQ